MNRRLIITVAAALCTACVSASDRPDTGVSQESPVVVRYHGPDIEALVSFRYANAHLGDEWMILQMSVTGQAASAVRIHRDAITLRTPDGARLPLLSQEEFLRSYGELYVALRRAEIASPPPGYFGGLREPCARWYFAAPATGIGYPEIDLTRHRVCNGSLVFRVPGGVQPGRWVLTIDLEETDARIPFVLGE